MGEPHTESLRLALSDHLPCSTGVFPVKGEDLLLFYRKHASDSAATCINFSAPAEEDIASLAESCEVATFGVNQKEVLDETYRKAGKLDASCFSAKFDPSQAGLMNVLRDVLLEGHGSNKSIRTELYKLNVYGPGSFFKAHKDTPRGDNMFASLVVVYPTTHEGGSLLFRHGNNEYTFDSAASISTSATPCVGFAAFYSDVEHEVTTVHSGYRITLTYNLYLEESSTETVVQFASAYEDSLRTTFEDILADTTYLPDGGYIGFGLWHEYPLKKTAGFSGWRTRESLAYLETALKGSDAVLMKVCKDLSIKADVRIVYRHRKYGLVLCERYMQSGSGPYDEGMGEMFWSLGGKHMKDQEGGEIREFQEDEYASCPSIDVTWATPMRPVDIQEVETTFMAWGNEPEMDFIYGTLCLIVEIPEKAARTKDLK